MQNGEIVKGLGDHVTLDGAAQALGLTYWGVRGLIKRHGVPTVRLGRTTLVRLEDVRRANEAPAEVSK